MTGRPGRRERLTVLAMLAVASFAYGQDEPRKPRPYAMPIYEEYYVFRNRSAASAAGELSLARKTGEFRHDYAVYRLQRYAVHAPFIVGTTEDGWFLLDTRGSWDTTTRPAVAPVRRFDSEAAWKAWLRRNDIPPDIALLDPDVEAARRDPREIRPWRYRSLGGLGGLDDDRWAMAVIFAGFAAAALVGFFSKTMDHLWVVGLVVGLICVVSAYFLLVVREISMVMALFAVPLLATMSAYLGGILRRILLWPWRRRQREGAADSGQGEPQA